MMFKVTSYLSYLFFSCWIGIFYFVCHKDLPAVNTSSHSIFHPSKRIMVLHYRHFYGKTLWEKLESYRFLLWSNIWQFLHASLDFYTFFIVCSLANRLLFCQFHLHLAVCIIVLHEKMFRHFSLSAVMKY